MTEETEVLTSIGEISNILNAIEENHTQIDGKITQLNVSIDRTIQMIELLKQSILFKLLECCKNITEPGAVSPREYASNLQNIKNELAKLKQLAVNVNASAINKNDKLQKTVDNAERMIDIIKPFIKILESKKCDENCNDADKIRELTMISEQIANVIYNEGVIISAENSNLGDIVTDIYDAIHLAPQFRNATEALILAVRAERNIPQQRIAIFKNVIKRYILMNFCIYLLSQSKLSYESVSQLIQNQELGIGGNNATSELTTYFFRSSNSNAEIPQLIEQYRRPPQPQQPQRRNSVGGRRRYRRGKSHKRPRKRTRGSRRAPPRRTRRYRLHK